MRETLQRMDRPVWVVVEVYQCVWCRQRPPVQLHLVVDLQQEKKGNIS